jgi:hypothetical protein
MNSPELTINFVKSGIDYKLRNSRTRITSTMGKDRALFPGRDLGDLAKP